MVQIVTTDGHGYTLLDPGNDPAAAYAALLARTSGWVPVRDDRTNRVTHVNVAQIVRAMLETPAG